MPPLQKRKPKLFAPHMQKALDRTKPYTKKEIEQLKKTMLWVLQAGNK